MRLLFHFVCKQSNSIKFQSLHESQEEQAWKNSLHFSVFCPLLGNDGCSTSVFPPREVRLDISWKDVALAPCRDTAGVTTPKRTNDLAWQHCKLFLQVYRLSKFVNCNIRLIRLLLISRLLLKMFKAPHGKREVLLKKNGNNPTSQVFLPSCLITVQGRIFWPAFNRFRWPHSQVVALPAPHPAFCQQIVWHGGWKSSCWAVGGKQERDEDFQSEWSQYVLPWHCDFARQLFELEGHKNQVTSTVIFMRCSCLTQTFESFHLIQLGIFEACPAKTRPA